jgi:hypothetical protein
MSIETTPGRNTPEPPTAEFPVDSHPDMLLVRHTSSDGNGRRVTTDHVRLAGTGLTVKVSPLESIDGACARLRAGLDRLATAITA